MFKILCRGTSAAIVLGQRTHKALGTRPAEEASIKRVGHKGVEGIAGVRATS